MVCTLSLWSSHATIHKNYSTFSFQRLQLSRKNLSSKNSYGTKIPSFTIAAAHKVSQLSHDCEICTPSQTFRDEQNKERDFRVLKSLTPLSSHSKLLFPMIFGFFGLQYAEQALAVMSTDVASNNLESFSFFGDLGNISTGILVDILLRAR